MPKKLIPKPCPFCGVRYRGECITMKGKAERFECPNCGAMGPFPADQRRGKAQSYYDKLTISAWNLRVKD